MEETLRDPGFDGGYDDRKRAELLRRKPIFR
jgi:hypothetical protein